MEAGGKVRSEGILLEKIHEFRYFCSNVESNRERGKEVKNGVQAGWRKVSEVIRYERVTAKVKAYRRVMRPVILFGLERWGLAKDRMQKWRWKS